MKNNRHIDFLIEEYKHFSESFWKNEEIGERRLNFYMTLFTAVLAGIIALVTTDQKYGVPIQSLVSFGLLTILIFGIFTLLRLIKRDRVTEEYKNIIRHLRHQIWGETTDGSTEYKLPFSRNTNRKWQGGLVETTAVMNSLLVAIISGMWLGHGWMWTLVVIFAILSYTIQMSIVEKLKSGNKENVKEAETFRANVGAMIINSKKKVLAFERKGYPGSWQLPQGGIDKGEEPLVALIREIEEETGLNKQHFKSILPFPKLLSYELPPMARSHKTGRGQTQYWFRLVFIGDEDDIHFGKGGEFVAWRWMKMEDLVEQVVTFRKGVYEELKNGWGK